MQVLIHLSYFRLTQALNDTVKDKVSKLSHLYEKFENTIALKKEK